MRGLVSQSEGEETLFTFRRMRERKVEMIINVLLAHLSSGNNFLFYGILSLHIRTRLLLFFYKKLNYFSSLVIYKIRRTGPITGGTPEESSPIVSSLFEVCFLLASLRTLPRPGRRSGPPGRPSS